MGEETERGQVAHHDIPADMPVMKALSITLPTEADTAAFGAKLAPALRGGDVALLEGPLGAGKSTLARGLIQAFCGALDVPSPTFTLVETYEGAKDAIWHFDLYRLEKPGDVWELGLEEALESGICLIEWPDRIESLLPDDVLRLHLEIKDDGGRRIDIHAPDRWAPALRQAGIA